MIKIHVKSFTRIIGRRNKRPIWVRFLHDVIIKKMSPLRFFAAAILVAGIVLALPIPVLKHAPRQDYFLFVASRAKKGIDLYKFNAAGPTFAATGTPTELAGVMALVPHPGSRFLYVLSAPNKLSAFAIHHDTGALRLLNTVELQHKDACALAIEKKGFMLLVSYCNSGGVESFRVAGDGGIANSAAFQQQDGPGTVAITPDNLFLFALGLDRIFQYRFDPAGVTFWPNAPATVAMKPGTHPVSLAFRPDQQFAYAVDEAASTLSSLNYRRDTGTLTLLDSIAAPGNPSALVIDSSGRFLYLSNRADNTIGVFSLDRKKGTPKAIGRLPVGGKVSTQLRIDPAGRYLFVALTQSNLINIFQIDPKTGLITPNKLSIDVPEPTAFQFVPILPEGIH